MDCLLSTIYQLINIDWFLLLNSVNVFSQNRSLFGPRVGKFQLFGFQSIFLKYNEISNKRLKYI